MKDKEITILNNEKYLRQISKEVDFTDTSYINDIKELEEYCKHHAVWAMAAIQIGIPKRIIYIKNSSDRMDKNFDASYDEAKILINPVILERKGHTQFLESCASCLDYSCVIDRPYIVIVEYFDIHGQFVKETFEGFESTVLSHEYDHLNGVLHLDLIKREDIMQLSVSKRKEYRQKHPYKIISKTCNYDAIRRKIDE